MAIVEKGLCKIEYLNQKGLGVGKGTLGPIEVPYVIPGETVEFERHQYRGKTAFILKEVLNTSKAREAPICKYFGTCGGCMLQHMSQDVYNQYKLTLIEQMLLESGLLFDPEEVMKNLIVVPEGSRRRANLEAIKKEGKVFLGFHRFHSHQIINIDSCPALVSDISNIIEALKEFLKKIMSDTQKAQIFVTMADNGIDILIEFKEINFPDKLLENHCLEFIKNTAVVSLAISTISQDHLKKIYQIAEPYINFGDYRVKIDSKAFLQATKETDQILANLILEHLPSQPEKVKIADLFCGRGTLTLPLSDVFNVEGFEIDTSAVKSLREAVNIKELAARPKIFERDLFTIPLTSKELEKYKFLVINPPRSGAQAQCTSLAESAVEKICYISCNPQTFFKDAQILSKGGYKLKTLVPIDQFYRSPHLEIFAVFKR